ncbi:hypothetical protein AB0L05_31505 [Nonomuraea pusilla]|uniref:hypothetical protein n=1 Tax=Nonomuraea pusilla TaxID=46177 RepID=UPI00332AACC7
MDHAALPFAAITLDGDAVAFDAFVRGRDGRVLVELERADVRALREAGWTPPERFRAKAADGVTDVHGLLHLPPDFDPSRRYPVLDHPYPGPGACHPRSTRASSSCSSCPAPSTSSSVTSTT